MPGYGLLKSDTNTPDLDARNCHQIGVGEALPSSSEDCGPAVSKFSSTLLQLNADSYKHMGDGKVSTWNSPARSLAGRH